MINRGVSGQKASSYYTRGRAHEQTFPYSHLSLGKAQPQVTKQQLLNKE